METKVNVYSVSNGKLIYSYNTNVPLNAGENKNQTVNIRLPQSERYNQVLPSTTFLTTEVDESNNMQHTFVKPQFNKAYYEVNKTYFTSLFKNTISSITKLKNEINTLPKTLKNSLNDNLNIDEMIEKLNQKVNNLSNNNVNKNSNELKPILIKKGDIICFEYNNLQAGVKNVWVSLIEGFNPTEKIVYESFEAIIMSNNILTDVNKDKGNILFGTSFYLTDEITFREPTESELDMFFKIIKNR